ncbi:hypothetical protein D5086_033991, partial [Populus alba]
MQPGPGGAKIRAISGESGELGGGGDGRCFGGYFTVRPANSSSERASKTLGGGGREQGVRRGGGRQHTATATEGEKTGGRGQADTARRPAARPRTAAGD